MVSQAAEPRARGPSRGVKAHMHGDVDWASGADGVCRIASGHHRRGARRDTSGRVEIAFVGDGGVSPPYPSNTTPTRAPVSCAAPRFPSSRQLLADRQTLPDPGEAHPGCRRWDTAGCWRASACAAGEGRQLPVPQSQVVRPERLRRRQRTAGLSSRGGAEESPSLRRGARQRPRMDLQVTAAGACVPHVDKTKEARVR